MFMPLENCALIFVRRFIWSFEWSFQWKITLMTIFLACVYKSKLESRMLITITNSDSSPDGGEFQWNFTHISTRILCVYAETSKTSFGRRSLRDLCVCAHMCLCTNLFLLSRIRILKTNWNHHSSYKFSLVFNNNNNNNNKLTLI